MKANGFRFGGIYIHPSRRDTRIVLTRTSEPPTQVMRTLPDLSSSVTALAQVRQHFIRFVDQCLIAGDESDRLRPLELLARVDPARALQYVQKTGFEESWFNDYIRAAVAKTLLQQNRDDAMAVIHSFESPMFRSMTLKEAAEALPDAHLPGKLNLLAEALFHARIVEAPDKRLANISMIAERYLDWGAFEQATCLLFYGPG